MNRFAWLTLLVTIGCAGTTVRGDPQALELGGALSNRFVGAKEASELSARLRIDARAIVRERRQPVNVALVIDTSGSMEGDAIRDATRAAIALVDAMSDGDRLAIVSFDSEARVLVPSTQIERGELEEIRERVRAMKAQGTTDMAAGLQRGLAELGPGYQPDGVNRIVLLSDGIPNESANIAAIADSARGQGVTITALGLGLEYDEALLASVAQRSGGRFRFLETSTEVAKVFEEEVLRLKRVVARNVVLAVRSGPGVTVKGIPGVAASPSGNGGFFVSLGDLAEGEQRDILVNFAVAGRREGANVELLDAVLSFDDAIAGAGRLERRVYFSAQATADRAKLEEGRNRDVQLSAARAEIAGATVEAIAQARAGRVDDARALLERADDRARTMAKELAADELAKEAASLYALREVLPSYAGTAPAESPAMQNNVKKAHDRAMQSLQDSNYQSAPVTW